jgi:hypothetical protein
VALALDGSNQGSSVSSGTTFSCTLTTTQSNDIIILVIECNSTGSNSVSDIHDGSSVISDGAWTFIASSYNTADGPNLPLIVYYAVAPTPLSSATITVTMSGAVDFGEVAAFGISGANTLTPLDNNGSLPATISGSATDPLSVSTNNPNDFIFGAYRTNTASPTSGSGWTQIIGNSYMLIEYQTVSSNQSGLSVTIGTGAGSANGGVATAIMGAGVFVARQNPEIEQIPLRWPPFDQPLPILARHTRLLTPPIIPFIPHVVVQRPIPPPFDQQLPVLRRLPSPALLGRITNAYWISTEQGDILNPLPSNFAYGPNPIADLPIADNDIGFPAAPPTVAWQNPFVKMISAIWPPLDRQLPIVRGPIHPTILATLNATLLTTEQGDTDVFSASIHSNAVLATTESGDTDVFSATTYSNAVLAAKELGDLDALAAYSIPFSEAFMATSEQGDVSEALGIVYWWYNLSPTTVVESQPDVLYRKDLVHTVNINSSSA